MYQEFRRDIETYASQAISRIREIIATDTIVFDHICYQTTSKKDYQIVLKELGKYITIEVEIPHAGRMITVALLKDPMNIDGVRIQRVEISQPKPAKDVRKRSVDHISFLIKGSFKEAVHHLREQGIILSEVKQIGDHHFIKIVRNGIELELRDKSLGKPYIEDGITEDKEQTSSEQKEIKIDGKTEEYEQRIAQLERNLEDEHKKALRALADYQNLVKRNEDHSRKTQSAINISILGQLIDIIDDFDRVIDNVKMDEKDQVGIRLLREKVQTIVNSYGIEPIQCFEGDELNPNMHEAVGVIAVENEKEHDRIKQIVQKGYKMKESGDIIRPVRVIVGKYQS